MSDLPASRRFSHQEFVRVLRTAAELQDALRIPARLEGFTLAEMEQIAADVGIPQEYVREAARTLGDGHTSFGDRLIGGSHAVQLIHIVPGHLDPGLLTMLLDELRRTTGKQGRVSHVLGELEWQYRDDLGSVHVSVAQRGEGIRLQLLADRQGAAQVLISIVPVLGLLAGGTIAGALGMDIPGIVLTMTGGFAASLVALRALWGRVTHSWRRQLGHMLNRLVAVIATSQATLPR